MTSLSSWQVITCQVISRGARGQGDKSTCQVNLTNHHISTSVGPWGKAVFICLEVSVNLVLKFQGTCFPRRMDPPKLLNLVRKSKNSQICGGGFLFNQRQSYQTWLAFRWVQPVICRQEQVKRTGRGCRAIFPRIDRDLALVLPLWLPLSLHPDPRFPTTNRGSSIGGGTHLPCVWWGVLWCAWKCGRSLLHIKGEHFCARQLNVVPIRAAAPVVSVFSARFCRSRLLRRSPASVHHGRWQRWTPDSSQWDWDM